MASNPYINKVQYGNDVLIDLTGDTATPEKVLQGETFHDASGARRTGSLVPASGGSWSDEKILHVGDTSVSFTGLDSTKSYIIFVDSAAGTYPPECRPIQFSGTTGTVDFDMVTADQAGGANGTSCKMKLRII